MPLLNWLYGPRITEVSAIGVYGRSYVINATTIEALIVELKREQTAHGELTNNDQEIEAAVLLWTRQGREISVPDLLEMHSYELEGIRLGNRQRTVHTEYGRVQLAAATPSDETVVRLVGILEGTGRARPIWRRLWVVAPWVVVIASAAALVIYLGTAQTQAWEVVALSSLLAVSVLAAIGGSLLIFRSVRSYWPPTIVRPYRWRDLVATRLTAIVAVATGVVGATLGAVLTAALSR